jgi:hypothetical protein
VLLIGESSHYSENDCLFGYFVLLSKSLYNFVLFLCLSFLLFCAVSGIMKTRRRHGSGVRYLPDYSFLVETTLDRVSCTVTAYSSNTMNTCWFPTKYIQGSLFGGCTCGRPSTNGIPCHHICAVVKSHRINDLTETNIMPT